MTMCAHGRPDLGGNDKVQLWARAGGACALCGADLLNDVRTHRRIRWGELAHIIGAKPIAARGDPHRSAALERDPDNIVLLCPSCHTKVDKDAISYSVERLRQAKRWHEQRVRMAASRVASAQVLPIVLTSIIGNTPNLVNDDVIAEALLQAGLVRGREATLRMTPIDPTLYGGRVAAYWEQHARALRVELRAQLASQTADRGALDAIAFFGRADMASLMAAGMLLGNRCALYIFQPRRADGRWTWPELEAKPPLFHWNDVGSLPGDGPIALVLSLSVTLPKNDVRAAFPAGTEPRIVEFTIDPPDFECVRGPQVGPAFHDAIRRCVGLLESHLSADRTIHVFPALPASLATHFGAAMSLNFIPRLQIYDRDARQAFVPVMQLPAAIAPTP